MTTIETPLGSVRGRAPEEGVYAFLGLPYAEPPVGRLRLRSPRPIQPWGGTRNTLVAAPASLQTLMGNQVWMNEPIPDQSEDCLYLNVWTPNVNGQLPVLIWLHGGQTRNGHGGAPGINGLALARRGIVVVTINYRLGALGGLAHPTRSLDDDQPQSRGFHWHRQGRVDRATDSRLLSHLLGRRWCPASRRTGSG